MEILAQIACAGSAGSATGTLTTPPLRGFLEAIDYKYASAPNTTTITVTEADGAARSLLSVGAGNTNGTAYVRAPAVNPSNSAISGSWAKVYLPGHALTIAIAGANNGSVITVRIQVSGDWE